MSSNSLYCPYCSGDLSSYSPYKGILGSSMKCPFCGKKIYYIDTGGIDGWYKFSPYTLLAICLILFVLLTLIFFPSSIACFMSWVTGH
jgi:hypothetical protein